MSHYKPYPAYKDSGVEWLGRVPEHWAVSPVKYLVTHIGSGKTPSGGSEVYQQSGVRFLRSQNVYEDGLQLEDVAYITESTDEEMKASRVKPLDVLLNITGASIGRSCQVPENFSNANVNQHVCIIRTHQADLSKWLSLCFPSQPAQSQIDLFQNGAGREGLNLEQIGNMVIGVPPREESGMIATHLDRETTRIDSLIAKKTRFIELLKEKRQALITQAVTKGLNPNVKMKDSGVEWLGEVPAHWEISSISRYFGIKAGGDLKEEYFSREHDLEHPYPIYTNSNRIDAVYGFTSKPIFEKNTITVTGRGEVGFAVYREQKYDAIIRLLVLSPKNGWNCKYSSYFINCILNFFGGNTAVAQLSAEQIAPQSTELKPVQYTSC